MMPRQVIPESNSMDNPFIEINVGTWESLSLEKVGKACSPSEQRKSKDHIQEFSDVFAWSYDDLKTSFKCLLVC
jgi:hypothetical protein